MKVIVLGTSEFTICCTRALIESGAEVCALISMPKKALPLNSTDMHSFAKRNNLPYYEIKNINSTQSMKLIKKYSPDYIFSSWPKILKKNILKLPKIFCIGTHPTDLPYNRGRHPLHWLIVLGINSTKLSFFVMDAGVDTGKVLLQVPFTIKHSFSVNEAISKMNEAVYKGTKRLLKILSSNPDYKGIPQNYRLVNYWRKRTPYDVMLDMRMSADMILRTVRSFSIPYSCANLIIGKYKMKIINASIAKEKITHAALQRIEHGRILKIKGKKISVKVDDEIVELECVNTIPLSLKKTKYIYPPVKYVLEYPESFAYCNE